MNAVGIDVSKGKSTVTVMQPFGVVVSAPHDVAHNAKELKELSDFIKALPEETRVVMEATGVYYEPIAKYLHDQGIFVSVVNPMVINNFGSNSIRKVKTDKKDAIKIAQYALNYWNELVGFSPEEEKRKTLRILNRQYSQAVKIKTMINSNLIMLLDSVFPGINKLFTSPARDTDGHVKWVDFVWEFPHCDSVANLTPSVFKKKYKSWCDKNSYHYAEVRAAEIHVFARNCTCPIRCTPDTVAMVKQTAKFMTDALENAHKIRAEMDRIASELPEYGTVISMYGIGKATGPQLMAEIGDVRRFHSCKAITSYFGYDTEPRDSGQTISKSRPMTKKVSPSLRRTLFNVMTVFITNQPPDEPVYQFLDKKRSEGKHYYCYMAAASAKFLRIYYAKVGEALRKAASSATGIYS